MRAQTAHEVKSALKHFARKEKARALSWFFKTGKGEYGEGDVFLGVMVPQQRLAVMRFSHLSLSEIRKLLQSRIHEHRLTALLMLVARYQREEQERARIYSFYLRNTSFVNNWDLVDVSARDIIGEHLWGKPRAVRMRALQRLARSRNLWERRIAMIATSAGIKRGFFQETFAIAQMLISDSHDLIHKAVGWMLREVGKRDRAAEERFLQRFYTRMPRTMLRYAIERFPEKERRHYLKKET